MSLSSQIVLDPKTDDVFVETFLIDALNLNDKGWKVSYDNPSEFDNTVRKSLGHPLVLYEREFPDGGGKIWDHPVSESGSVEADIEFQKPYIVGKAVHNKKVRDGLWHTSYKIIHEGAKRFLKSIKESSIDLFTSPHIVRPVLEDRQNIKTWAVIHNAIVSSPANGKQLAKVASICQGDPQGACASLFASMDTPDQDTTKCSYCLGDSLKEYIHVTSHSLKSESSSNNMSESQGQQAGSQGQPAATGQGQSQTSNPNPITNNNNNQQQLLQQKQNKGNDGPSNEVQENDAAKTIAELTEKIKALESNNQSQQQSSGNNDAVAKAEQKIADLEKKLETRDRTANVEKLLTQAISLYTDDSGSVNEKEYNGDLDKLVKSSHNIEEIQELIQAKFVLHQHAKGKLIGNKASNTSPDLDNFSSQVSESASIHYTEMNGSESHQTETVTESASNSVKKKFSQNYVNVLNNINNERLQLRSQFSQGGLV